jgi:hypothetical protein
MDKLKSRAQSAKNAASVVTKDMVFVDPPTFVHYGRVILDVVLVILLMFVVIADVGREPTLHSTKLHIHEMPVYLKQSMGFSDMWHEAHLDVNETPEGNLTGFQKLANHTCHPIAQHPMCVCIAHANTTVRAKNCLLQQPMPSVTKDWNIGAVSPAMLVWFLASLATSVGTLPIVSSYISVFSMEGQGASAHIVSYNKFIIATYLVITACALFVPILVTATEFPNDGKHMENTLGMLMWSLFAVGILGAYNSMTFIRYVGYFSVDAKQFAADAVNDAGLLHLSMNNWLLYVHLLVSAPAIAMVVHLTQQWAEFHTIINTTLILSTIFAVDAFSVEMSNFWSHRNTRENTSVKRSPEKGTDDHKTTMKDMHTRLGLIRLFAWVTNAVMLLLLLTLSYPIEMGQQATNSAIFVVVVVAYSAVFLVPDLIREFTDMVSFNCIQFRLYGDFMVRALTLFFVWRASVVERT